MIPQNRIFLTSSKGRTTLHRLKGSQRISRPTFPSSLYKLLSHQQPRFHVHKVAQREQRKKERAYREEGNTRGKRLNGH